MRIVLSTLLLVGFGLLTVSLSGCNSGGDTETAAATTEDHADDHDHDADGEHADHDHDHGGWWCAEHGVPEEECALCDVSLVAEFKENGDWCEEHSRPDSQCFECNPENLTKFAARYEAKFGEQPPKPTE